MALGTTAQKANIKRSLERYFNDNLGPSGENFKIDMEGLPFETIDKDEWLQPRILDFASEYLRQASGTEYGSQVDILFNVNVFVTKSGTSYADRHYRIRDKVVNYFKCGQRIAISDCVSGSTVTVDYMKVRDLVTDRVVPDENFLQYSLAWEIDYTEQTINP